VFSDGVFAVLITVLVPGAITTNMGQIAAATQSATEATSRVRRASQELAAWSCVIPKSLPALDAGWTPVFRQDHAPLA